MSVVRRDVRAFADAAAAVRAAADDVARQVRGAVETGGACVLALAGGGTPRALHAELVTRHGDLPWDAVHVFFGDERCVPPDHPESNYRMARETLLGKLPFRPDRVHRMAGEAPDADLAARDYEARLRRTLAEHDREGPDLVLLGLGTDGHTASLFPGSPALDERVRWVVPADAPAGVSPPHRLTLTFPALAAAARVLFLVTGAAKREAMRAVLGDAPPPAGRVVARNPATWFVDGAAMP